MIATGVSIPLLCLEGVPDLSSAPKDEAGLRRKFDLRLFSQTGEWEIRLVCPIWGNLFIEAKPDPFLQEIWLWGLERFVLWVQMGYNKFHSNS